MARIENEPALVLHTRPYRESSLLVDLLTAHHGRVGAVLKGGRSRLQVFSTFPATWYGRDLVTLAQPKDVEARWLTGLPASAGLYLNELVIRTVREREPVPELFAMSCWALAQLSADQGDRLRPVLRTFERALLKTLGYEIDYQHTTDPSSAIVPEGTYLLADASGFVLAPPLSIAEQDQLQRRGYLAHRAGLIASGTVILAVADEAYEQPVALAAARRIYSRCLAPLLGDRPLKSRELLSGAAP